MKTEWDDTELAQAYLKRPDYAQEAVEPNDAMRANGISRTAQYVDVEWFEGIGEHTGMKDQEYLYVPYTTKIWMAQIR